MVSSNERAEQGDAGEFRYTNRAKLRSADLSQIVIAGGGVVGLSTACILAQAGLSVLILEPKPTPTRWQPAATDLRVVALTRASQLLLARADVWPAIVQKRVAPYRAMQVWDGAGTGDIVFKAEDVAEHDLGHIVELSAIEQSLREKLASLPNAPLRYGVGAEGFDVSENAVHVHTSDGQSISAKLLIACDGAQSPLRKIAGIACHQEDYQHHALVAQIQCEKSHQQTAWQRFTPTGPLALLPLADEHQCSIVWSTPADETNAYLALSAEEFSEKLSQAFEHRLGALQLNSTRLSFALIERHAERYLAPRFALLGDAAHTMHPLAGQGLNQSLGDVQALCEQLLKLQQQKRDYGLMENLRPFERARRSEAALMLAAVKGFKTLFTQHQAAIVLARNWGMSALNKHPIAKAEIIRRAMGMA